MARATILYVEKVIRVHRALVAGPFPPPINGMTLANQWVYEGLQRAMNVTIVELEIGTKREPRKDRLCVVRRIISRARFAQRSVHEVHVTMPDVVYTTPGQSVLGLMYTYLFTI
jgi:hypothetical protein